MSIEWSVLLVIIGCALVTMLPRVIPFLVVRNIALPTVVMRWLSYIPVCILTALIVESALDKQGSTLYVDWHAVIVLVPTLLIALKTKSLSITVITGVVLMAGVRYWL
ncbi:AzlD domain-containing protein [Paenibacillus sp. WLX2291]|uniref:AzlD domain-containing protein n=1 Tax=Paenibacillus sp. WLX2291 TaxID=3296934 RepID=UPI003983E51B